MNIALPRTVTSHRGALVGFLVGAVLAVAAGVGVWQLEKTGSNPTSPALSSAGASSDWYINDDRVLLLYLVDSDAQADMVRTGDQQAASERASSGIPDPNYSLVVLKVTTPDEELNVHEVMEAWTSTGSGVLLQDIRGR